MAFQCPHGLELLRRVHIKVAVGNMQFQCPLGLIPHFYPKRYEVPITDKQWFQCPLGLIPHFYGASSQMSVQSTKKFQCPLGLIPHFYVPLQKPRFYAVSRACFCRYLSEYSGNSRFSCMLTFWTYLMRCTYP